VLYLIGREVNILKFHITKYFYIKYFFSKKKIKCCDWEENHKSKNNKYIGKKKFCFIEFPLFTNDDSDDIPVG
jgi:hypothetical protein